MHRIIISFRKLIVTSLVHESMIYSIYLGFQRSTQIFDEKINFCVQVGLRCLSLIIYFVSLLLLKALISP